MSTVVFKLFQVTCLPSVVDMPTGPVRICIMWMPLNYTFRAYQVGSITHRNLSPTKLVRSCTCLLYYRELPINMTYRCVGMFNFGFSFLCKC